MIKKKIIYLLMLILTVPGGNAMAERKAAIAVISFKTNNVLPSYGEIVRNQLEVSLYKTGAFTILERAQIDKVLEEQEFRQTGCTDTYCAVEIGKLLSMDYVIVGSVDRISKFMLSVKAVNVGRGAIAYADSRSMEKEEDIPAALQSIAESIAGKIKEDPGPYENPEKPEIIAAGYHDFYGWLSLGLCFLGLGGAGTGFYFNNELNKSNDRYDRMADQYAVTTDMVEVNSLKRDMKDEKDKGDTYALYRNISYGIGAVSIAGSIYFFYRFMTTKPEAEKKPELHKISIFPVFSCNPYLPNCDKSFVGIAVSKGF